MHGTVQMCFDLGLGLKDLVHCVAAVFKAGEDGVRDGVRADRDATVGELA